jgi:RNA polymerase sigma-70 factor (ECF subfamily)
MANVVAIEVYSTHMTTSDSTAEQLLARFENGDQSALNALMNLHRDYLRRVIDFQMEPPLRQRIDPSDVIQEAYLEATRRIDDYLRRRPMSFRVWLRQTACQRLGMLRRFHLGAEQRSVSREMEPLNASSIAIARKLLDGQPHRIMEDRERAAQVHQALAQLNETDYEILVLRAFEGLSNQEAAESLGIDATAACKRYGRALIHLRDKLDDAGFKHSS